MHALQQWIVIACGHVDGGSDENMWLLVSATRESGRSNAMSDDRPRTVQLLAVQFREEMDGVAVKGN